MIEIGVLLVIFFAVASMANRRAQQKQAAETRGKNEQSRPRPAGPFQQAVRQLQESMERAAGIEPGENGKPTQAEAQKVNKNTAAGVSPKEWESGSRRLETPYQEQAFRGSLAVAEDALGKSLEGRPGRAERAAPEATGRTLTKSPRIIPPMTRSSLVQAVVMQEVLNRPRSAWQHHPAIVRERAPRA
ncbi:MAG: hypothetical protein GX124_02965 [Clostridiales bacterium]|jgi:hypothetical protein|nr:hypothetical protein [Clostridiales bacterium]